MSILLCGFSVVCADAQTPDTDDSKAQKAQLGELHKVMLDPATPPDKVFEAATKALLINGNDILAQDARKTAQEQIKQKQADQQKQEQAKAEEQKAKADAAQKETKKNALVDEANAAMALGNLSLAESKMNEALALVPGDKSALDAQKSYHDALSKKSTLFYAEVGLGAILVAALGVGAFFAFRPKKVILKVTEGWDTGLEFPIDRNFVRVGSSAEHSEIVVQDEENRLSRIHLEVHRKGRRLFIKDVSSNGTRVNGRPITRGRTTRVRKGDVITLADVTTLELH